MSSSTSECKYFNFIKLFWISILRFEHNNLCLGSKKIGLFRSNNSILCHSKIGHSHSKSSILCHQTNLSSKTFLLLLWQAVWWFHRAKILIVWLSPWKACCTILLTGYKTKTRGTSLCSKKRQNPLPKGVKKWIKKFRVRSAHRLKKRKPRIRVWIRRLRMRIHRIRMRTLRVRNKQTMCSKKFKKMLSRSYSWRRKTRRGGSICELYL